MSFQLFWKSSFPLIRKHHIYSSIWNYPWATSWQLYIPVHTQRDNCMWWGFRGPPCKINTFNTVRDLFLFLSFRLHIWNVLWVSTHMFSTQAQRDNMSSLFCFSLHFCLHFLPRFLLPEGELSCKIATRQQCARTHLIFRPARPWVNRWAQVHLLFKQHGTGCEIDNYVGLELPKKKLRSAWRRITPSTW